MIYSPIGAFDVKIDDRTCPMFISIGNFNEISHIYDWTCESIDISIETFLIDFFSVAFSLIGSFEALVENSLS